MASQAQIEIVLLNGQRAGTTIKELSKTANKLNKEIKDLEPGSDAFIKKSAELQVVGNRLRDVKDQAYGAKQASGGLLDVFSQFIPFSGKFNQLSGSMGNLKGGVGGVTKGFGTLKTAIIATGIGALILLITSLVSWFKKTQRGAELLAKAQAAIGAAIGVLIDRAVKLIDVLKLLTQGKWREANEKFKESVTGIADEIVNETKQAWKLRDALFAIERAENDLILKRAVTRSQVKDLNKIAENTTKSYKERANAAQQAINIEQALLAEQIETQRKRAANALGLLDLTDEKLADIKKNGLKLEDVGLSESLEEDRKKAIEEIAKIYELQEQSVELQTTLQNKLNTIRDQSHAKEMQRIQKRQEALSQAEEERAKYEEEIAKAVEEQGKVETEQLQKQLEEIKRLRDEGHKNNLENLAIQADEEKLQRDILFADRKLTEEDYNRQLFEVEKARLEAILQEQIKYYGENSNEARKAQVELTNAVIAEKQRESQAFIDAEQKKLDAATASASTTASMGSQLFGNLADLYDEGSDEYKAFAFFQAELAAIQAAIESFKVGAEIGGPPLGIIWAAASYAFTQPKIMKMKTTEKAEFGTILRGNRHAFGGIPAMVGNMPYELEDGEIVLTRAVAMDPAGLAAASELNARYGGTTFMQSGGQVSSVNQPSKSSTKTYSESDTKILMEILARLEDIMDGILSWPEKLKVINDIKEVRDQLKVLNNLEQSANF